MRFRWTIRGLMVVILVGNCFKNEAPGSRKPLENRHFAWFLKQSRIGLSMGLLRIRWGIIADNHGGVTSLLFATHFFSTTRKIRLETRRFLGRRPEFLAVCRVVAFCLEAIR